MAHVCWLIRGHHLKDTKKLTKLQYFEWSLAIERLNHAKTRARLAWAESNTQQQKARAENLEYQLLKTRAMDSRNGVESARQAYEDEKKQLEKKLGISLSGKIINENLEILDEQDL